ncbi:MAG: GDP-L-fucose synthase, partial [Bdellovibrionota bacterium]
MQNVKIFLAGHNGLAGSAISRELSQNGYSQIITRSHSELDLTDKEATFAFFKTQKPDWVFLCAAKVGGILANSSYPVDFLLTNLKIQNNVLEACFNFQTSKLLFLGSSCIYPKFAPQPISEDALLTGLLEPTNEPYALAKITGIKLCNAFNRQYETNYLCVMPSNLYGPNDNYHSEDAHVLPMLLRRFHEAKLSHAKSVTVWGTGKPLREFLFSQDLA